MSHDLELHKRRRTMEEEEPGIPVASSSGLWSLPRMYENFSDMNLKVELLRGIFNYGFHKPYITQQVGIVPFCEGANVVLQAASHPAKTITYCIGILQRIDPSLLNCQCLVVTHGPGYIRDVKADLEALGCYLGVKVHTKENAHIVIGHSHDLCNLLRTGKVCSENIKMVIFDGADLLLNQDSRMEQVNDMFGMLPIKPNEGLQVGFLSEMMPAKILDNIMKIVKNPVLFQAIDPDEFLILNGIQKHFVIPVKREDSKTKALVTLLEQSRHFTIVFVDNLTKVSTLAEEVMSFGNGIVVSVTRSGMNNKARAEIIEDFFKKTRVLITTRLWARGMIDLFDRVSLIIHYDGCMLPQEYLGRIGLFRRVPASVCFATPSNWVDWIATQSEYNIFIEDFSPSTFIADTESIRDINVLNKDRQCKHFVYNIGNEEDKVEELESSLWKDLTAAETSVIFVSCLERVSKVVNIMSNIPNCTLHFTSDIVDMENRMGPRVFVTSVEEVDVQLKVNLVINYDAPSTLEHYYRRLLWCRINGLVVHFATEMDWFEVWRMQISCSVFLRPLPRSLDSFYPLPAEVLALSDDEDSGYGDKSFDEEE